MHTSVLNHFLISLKTVKQPLKKVLIEVIDKALGIFNIKVANGLNSKIKNYYRFFFSLTDSIILHDHKSCMIEYE